MDICLCYNPRYYDPPSRTLLELSLDTYLIITLCAVSFFAGIIDAIVGGGGMLTVPTLLASGLPPHVALGTNKLAATFGSCTASFAFYRQKLFNPHFWRFALFATAIGAILGTIVVHFINVDFLEKYLPVLIMVTALYTFFAKKSIPDSQNTLPTKGSKLYIKQTVQGGTLGFYDGLAGPGTGAFWTSSSSALYKINILLSCGLARSANFISNICSLFTFIYLGHVNFLIGILMGFFIMMGAWIGAHSAIKFGGKFIRPIFISVVVLISLNLAYNAWF